MAMLKWTMHTRSQKRTPRSKMSRTMETKEMNANLRLLRKIMIMKTVLTWYWLTIKRNRRRQAKARANLGHQTYETSCLQQSDLAQVPSLGKKFAKVNTTRLANKSKSNNISLRSSENSKSLKEIRSTMNMVVQM